MRPTRPLLSAVVIALWPAGCARTMTGDTSPGGAGAGVQPVGQSTLFIRQVNALDPTNGTCAASGAPEGRALLAGILDLALRLPYEATLLLGFQPVGNVPNAPAGIAFQQATVHVEDTTGKVLWGPVTQPVAGFADISSDHVTYGLTQVILLGTGLGESLASDLQSMPGLVRHLTSFVRVSGKTVGGGPLESDDWSFPIQACYGCLLTFPREADDVKLTTQPNCDLLPTSGTALDAPCRVGQDDAVDCRVCKELLPNSALCEP